MVSTRARSKRRLGQFLRDAGVLEESQLKTALMDQRQWGGRLGRILVDRGYVDEETLVHALCRQLALPSVHLDSAAVDPHALAALPLEVVERYHVFPIGLNRHQGILRIASADPTNVQALEALTFHSKHKVLFSLAGEEAISRAIRRNYGRAELGVTQANLAFQWPGKVTEVLGRKHAQVDARIGSLEEMVESQGRALRSMLELLDSEGVIRREQFLERLHAPRSSPPPLPLERTTRSRRLPELSAENATDGS